MVPILRFCLALILLLFPMSVAQAVCQGTEIAEGVYEAPFCIPRDVKRIVTLDPLLTLGLLIELEAPVVATPYMAIQDPGILNMVRRSKMVDLGDPKEPSLERIVALKPDLIIGSTEAHARLYEKASKIAPTVFFSHMDWKTYLRILAGLVGREAVAKEALAAYETRVASIRARMRRKDVTVSAVRFAPGRFVVFVDGPASYVPFGVLRDAGVRRTPYETVTDGTIVKRPDWEDLAKLDGDILLYVSASGYESGPDDALEREVIENPFWQLLPAVRNGRAHRVDRVTWQSFHGIGSAHRVLDDIERYILTAP